MLARYFAMTTTVCVAIVLSQLLFNTYAFAIPSTDSTGLDLTILHNNDMHAHFEQTDVYSGTCKPKDAAANKCFGGFARVSSLVKQYRHQAQNDGTAFLYLNAGDSYTGTPWYSIFRHKVVSDFLNILKPDAMVCFQYKRNAGPYKINYTFYLYPVSGKSRIRQ